MALVTFHYFFQEGKELLAGEKLADTRQETAVKKSKTPLKKNVTMGQTVDEGR